LPPIPVAQVSPYALAADAGVISEKSLPPNTTAPRERLFARGPPANALAYRINDAVQISGLSRSTIYKLIAENRLRSVMVAGRRLILADALRELLQGGA
jgi:excisionase family DNA binding protein